MVRHNGSIGRLLMAMLLIVGMVGFGMVAGCNNSGGSGSSSSASQNGGGGDPSPSPTPAQPISLEWSAPTTNSDGSDLNDLGGYRLYYGKKRGVYTSQVDVGNSTSVQVESLSSGTYFFAVTAYNTSGGESEFSNEVSAVAQ